MNGKHSRPQDARGSELSVSRQLGAPSYLKGAAQFFRGRVIRSIFWIILFIGVFLAWSGAWKLNLRQPIFYWGDALEMHAYFGRDYIFNDLRERWFAPFGIEHDPAFRYLVNFAFQPNSTLVLLAYLVTRDAVGALTLYYLLTFLATFMSAYWVYGRLKLADPFRFGAATLYALMPYHFQRSVGHLMESSYFVVPLLAYIVILAFARRPFFHAYDYRGWQFTWRQRQDWFVLGVTLCLSSINDYHQFFFMILLAFAAVASALWHRNLRILVGTAIVIAAAGLATVTKMHLNESLNPPELSLALTGAPITSYTGDEETYGLKIIQVILPVGGHRLPVLQRLAHMYDSVHTVNENATVAIGLFGAAGFVFLVVRGAYLILAKKRKTHILDILSFLTLGCVLVGTVGGIGAIVATFGAFVFGPQAVLAQIRSYNRIVVFMGFFSYYASSVLLSRLRRPSVTPALSRWPAGMTRLCTWLPFFLFALWDQAPYPLQNDAVGMKQHSSDKQFFRRVEAQLPTGAMVFQYPFNIHHGDPNSSAHGTYNYADGIRPYLNSRKLRFTYGADEDSAQVDWLEQTSALPVEQMIQRLCQYGFSGIVVHRQLFKTSAEAGAFETQLSTVLGLPLQFSNDQDFSFAPLNEFCSSKGIATIDLAAERSRLLEGGFSEVIDFRRRSYPPVVARVTGLSFRESWGRWTEGPVAEFRFKRALPAKFTVYVTANGYGPNIGEPVKVRVGNVEKTFTVGNNGSTYSVAFETDGTATVLQIISPKPTSPNDLDPKNTDTRKIGIGLASLKIGDHDNK